MCVIRISVPTGKGIAGLLGIHRRLFQQLAIPDELGGNGAAAGTIKGNGEIV